jgi:hypothetical protein
MPGTTRTPRTGQARRGCPRGTQARGPCGPAGLSCRACSTPSGPIEGGPGAPPSRGSGPGEGVRQRAGGQPAVDGRGKSPSRVGNRSAGRRGRPPASWAWPVSGRRGRSDCTSHSRRRIHRRQPLARLRGDRPPSRSHLRVALPAFGAPRRRARVPRDRVDGRPPRRLHGLHPPPEASGSPDGGPSDGIRDRPGRRRPRRATPAPGLFRCASPDASARASARRLSRPPGTAAAERARRRPRSPRCLRIPRSGHVHPAPGEGRTRRSR